MKPELLFLSDLLGLAKEPATTMSDIRTAISSRMEDLNLGYSKEDAREILQVEKIQSGLQIVDDFAIIDRMYNQ